MWYCTILQFYLSHSRNGFIVQDFFLGGGGEVEWVHVQEYIISSLTIFKWKKKIPTPMNSYIVQAYNFQNLLFILRVILGK